MLLNGLETLLGLWFITVPLIIILSISATLIYKSEKPFPRRLFYVPLYALAVSAVIGYLGWRFFDTKSSPVQILVLILAGSVILYYLYDIVKSKGYRLFILSLGGLVIIFLLGIFTYTLMAIENSW